MHEVVAKLGASRLRRSAGPAGSRCPPSASTRQRPAGLSADDVQPGCCGRQRVNLDWLYRLYAWAIGYMVAVIVALGVIAALASYLVWLVVIVVLLIAARIVWWYTRW